MDVKSIQQWCIKQEIMVVNKGKIELLVPASSLEVLKIAVIYGADAVYIGGEAFGLRAKAKNFSMEEMAEGIAFAHARGVKVYVTVNICVRNVLEEHCTIPDAGKVVGPVVSVSVTETGNRMIACRSITLVETGRRCPVNIEVIAIPGIIAPVYRSSGPEKIAQTLVMYAGIAGVEIVHCLVIVGEDFVRFGWPWAVLSLILVIVVTPLIFPFFV